MRIEKGTVRCGVRVGWIVGIGTGASVWPETHLPDSLLLPKHPSLHVTAAAWSEIDHLGMSVVKFCGAREGFSGRA